MLGNREKATHPPEISLDFVGVCKSGCFLHIVGKHIQFNINRKENEHLFARTTLAGKRHSHPGGASMALSLLTCFITFFEKVQQINSTWATQMRQASCIVFRSAFETQQKATRPPQISFKIGKVCKSTFFYTLLANISEFAQASKRNERRRMQATLPGQRNSSPISTKTYERKRGCP